MIDKVTTKECYLCKACGDVCVADAISFAKEEKGFVYPQIDFSKCIKCNMCEKVCPALCELSIPRDGYPIAYAAQSKNIDVRLKSTSGGMFFEMASKVIQSGGVVCGAVFDEEFKVVHKIAENSEELKKMCGSKYAQSDMSGIFRKIKNKLQNGKNVLFSGCPCQTLALKKYVKIDYDNLILVDFICHGIPSQKFLDAYIKKMEEKYHSKIKSVCFRDKSRGWHSSSVKMKFENGKTYKNPITVDAYMTAFLNGTIMKERCYECHMKGFRSGSDITLGDFWGAELVFPELDDNMGVSAVFVNTEKGARLLEKIGIDRYKTDGKEIIKYNQNVMVSTMMNPKREEFYTFCQTHEIGEALIEFFGESKYEAFQRKLWYRLRCVRNRLQGKEKPLY